MSFFVDPRLDDDDAASRSMEAWESTIRELEDVLETAAAEIRRALGQEHLHAQRLNAPAYECPRSSIRLTAASTNREFFAPSLDRSNAFQSSSARAKLSVSWLPMPAAYHPHSWTDVPLWLHIHPMYFECQNDGRGADDVVRWSTTQRGAAPYRRQLAAPLRASPKPSTYFTPLFHARNDSKITNNSRCATVHAANANPTFDAHIHPTLSSTTSACNASHEWERQYAGDNVGDAECGGEGAGVRSARARSIHDLWT
ncbi:hypothetical protein C8R46DRAFT_1219703 [Mycena filopes]|nr:hypothetical protein C8R46DRAFT_1219703 [Mycena filopes]